MQAQRYPGHPVMDAVTKTIDSKATFSGWLGGQSQGAVAPS